jgi:hypothetical protein
MESTTVQSFNRNTGSQSFYSPDLELFLLPRSLLTKKKKTLFLKLKFVSVLSKHYSMKTCGGVNV